jgi:hypothetical protein
MTIAFHFFLIVVDNDGGGQSGDAGKIAARSTGSRPRRRCRVGGKSMTIEFHVCWRVGDAQWIVRLGNDIYGAYLDKEQALLDAVDAARDALQSGREAQVWLRDDMSSARIL